MANKGKKTILKIMYGKRCMLCGEKKCDNELTFHHIKPKSAGGQATVQNGALLCRDCQDFIHQYDFLTEEFFDYTLKILSNKEKFNQER